MTQRTNSPAKVDLLQALSADCMEDSGDPLAEILAECKTGNRDAQLRLYDACPGKLDRLRGMVVGRLVGCEPPNAGGGLSIEEILRTHLKATDYPVVLDLPAGHADAKITLPLGRTARLETDPPRLTFPAPVLSGP